MAAAVIGLVQTGVLLDYGVDGVGWIFGYLTASLLLLAALAPSTIPPKQGHAPSPAFNVGSALELLADRLRSLPLARADKDLHPALQKLLMNRSAQSRHVVFALFAREARQQGGAAAELHVRLAAQQLLALLARDTSGIAAELFPPDLGAADLALGDQLFSQSAQDLAVLEIGHWESAVNESFSKRDGVALSALADRFLALVSAEQSAEARNMVVRTLAGIANSIASDVVPALLKTAHIARGA